ncbi:protein arginine N-methyltransferase 6 [Anopheles bellator]|uniref:protein arginine N-methyltransferase 6 n=1 Tax=Anopheles bellator TaxID=139047 RepID=UPI0026492DBD|nr:protein arginine N-methyltransferase 6 [Anopheles bellator]
METETDPAEYFDSYEDLKVHELMLTDKPRQTAYRDAILGNRDLFEGKTVLDVGAGTGILSIFSAQAGATKVYAVEASNLARLAREVVKENHFENVIEVSECRVEDFRLPPGEQVDIIVSEWMGFFLLHEGMLDSVLYARDNFLKPTGLMFPDTATIYIAPCSVPSRFDQWDDLSGVSMACFGRALRQQSSKKPEVLTVAPKHLLHEGHVVTWLDLKEVTADELHEFEVKEVLVAQRAGKLQGFCIWFDCTFPTGERGGKVATDVVLSTNPTAPETHWKQTVIPLPEGACEELEERDPLAFTLTITRNRETKRRYDLQLMLLDAEKEDHGLPCECQMTKCILMKAHLEKMQVDQ